MSLQREMMRKAAHNTGTITVIKKLILKNLNSEIK